MRQHLDCLFLSGPVLSVGHRYVDQAEHRHVDRDVDRWHCCIGGPPLPLAYVCVASHVDCVVSAFLKEWKVTLRGLRHSHASHMLASNIHPKIVQERLGHSSIAITMDIYSHLMPNMQADAAAKVDAAFRAVSKKK